MYIKSESVGVVARRLWYWENSRMFISLWLWTFLMILRSSDPLFLAFSFWTLIVLSKEAERYNELTKSTRKNLIWF